LVSPLQLRTIPWGEPSEMWGEPARLGVIPWGEPAKLLIRNLLFLIAWSVNPTVDSHDFY
jgi:hypothetical protein